MAATIAGTKNPIIGTLYTYSVSSHLPITNEKWELYLDKKQVFQKTVGEVTFGNIAFGKTYRLVCTYEEVSTKTKGKAEISLVPLLGEPKIVKVHWEDSARNVLDSKKAKVSYLEPVFLIIDTANIPKGEKLEVTFYEDEYESGHGSSSVKMDEIFYTPIRESGRAEIELSTKILEKFMDKANANDLFFTDVEHDYYVQIKYNDTINVIEDKAQLKVKNKVEFLKKFRSAKAVTLDEEKYIHCNKKYCIKKGDKNALVQEINIRLAGFGGCLPTDEFTELTEKCVKQFQRDYMEIPETGRVCGRELRAIEDFSNLYNFNFSQTPCPCINTGNAGTGTTDYPLCDGYGNGRVRDGRGDDGKGKEYPGIHRSLLFILKAFLFYLEKTKSVYKLTKISSGYRCYTDNKRHPKQNGKPRSSTNHMGCALDLNFNKKTATDMDTIRKDFFCKYMEAPGGDDYSFGWKSNRIGLEPTRLGANSWVHVDVREFDSQYKKDIFFIKKAEDIVGKSLIKLAKELGFSKTCECFGENN